MIDSNAIGEPRNVVVENRNNCDGTKNYKKINNKSINNFYLGKNIQHSPATLNIFKDEKRKKNSSLG